MQATLFCTMFYAYAFGRNEPIQVGYDKVYDRNDDIWKNSAVLNCLPRGKIACI